MFTYSISYTICCKIICFTFFSSLTRDRSIMYVKTHLSEDFKADDKFVISINYRKLDGSPYK